ncbi:hypothetical protein C8R47DRAFT_30599 [Mycena vitilis]|nr:hypothetical protein C8R47DRAFT_30599 [Mycena vitilis]
MALVASRLALSSLDQPIHDDRSVAFIELGPSSDAVEPFKQLILQSHIADLRLYCTVPTGSDNCLDLHDLHQLRSKFLVFIHNLVQTLRSSGMTVSYVLVPSSSSRCIMCAGGCTDLASAVDIMQKTPLENRQNVLYADLGCPCAIFL